MKYVNLTPHEVNLKQPDGSYLKIKPENRAARVVDGIVYNLPEYEEGTILIVSHITQKAAGNRRDLRRPYGKIRKNGKIVGCWNLVGSGSPPVRV